MMTFGIIHATARGAVKCPAGSPREAVGGEVVSRFLADALVVFHLAFVIYVVLGGVLVLRWRSLAILHLPAALYGVAVEIFGWTCPLTPLENALRRRGGQAGYRGGFVEHYLLPILYPGRMPSWMPWALAALVAGANAAIYGLALWRARPAEKLAVNRR
jgi:hypothetical protein